MLKNYRNNRCYIIAEIGGNFKTFEEGKLLIDAAAEAGADAVKLQTYRADTISSRTAMFEMENTGVLSQYDFFKEYELSEALHEKIFVYASEKNLDCFSTPSHQEDVELLERLGVAAHKIGSDDAVNLPFLRYVARKKKPVILATGMCTLQEVRESVAAILEEGNSDIIILHAVTAYPTHPEDINLLSIQTLIREFPSMAVGYSDHSMGPDACIFAAILGAKVIEKHFTLNKKAEGPDHMHSSDPLEMKRIVDAVRLFERMRGSGIKMPAAGESGTRINNRKSLVLARDKISGERLSEEDIAIKRPGYGIQPKDAKNILGRAVARDMKVDEVLSWQDLQ